MMSLLASTVKTLFLDFSQGCFDEVSRFALACIWPEFTSIWPGGAIFLGSWREAGVRSIPKMGLGPASVGCPIRSSGGGALLGKTRNVVHHQVGAESNDCKKIWAKRYL